MALLLVVVAMLAALPAPGYASGAADGERAARALKAFQSADYEAALKDYQELARSSPTPEVLLQVARCLDRLLSSNEAIVAYLRYLASGPSSTSTSAKEARDRIAFLRRFLGRDASAETRARQAIDRGVALYKLELLSDAREEFEAAASALPDRPIAQRWLGLTLERLGSCREAIAHYDAFLARAGSDETHIAEVTDARSRCAARLAGEARPRAAGGAAWGASERAGGEGDEKVKLHLDRGIDHYSAGRYREAREEFAFARTLAPDQANPFRWLGLADAKLDRCGDAIANLEVFLQRVQAPDPRLLEAREVIAACRERLPPGSRASRPPDARPGSSEDEIDDRARLLTEKGVGLYQQGRYREARDAFATARALLPDRPAAYRWLGLTDVKLGRCSEAVASFDVFLSHVRPDDERVAEVTRERQRCRGESGQPPQPASTTTSGSASAMRTSASSTPAATGPGVSPAARESSGALPVPVVVKPAPRPRPLAAPIGVGVSALALLGAGAGLTAAGLARYNDLLGTCAPRCLQSDSDSVSAEVYTGYALLGVGAAAGVADGLLWYLWWRNHSRSHPRPRAAAIVVPTSQGARIAGYF